MISGIYSLDSQKYMVNKLDIKPEDSLFFAEWQTGFLMILGAEDVLICSPIDLNTQVSNQ